MQKVSMTGGAPQAPAAPEGGSLKDRVTQHLIETGSIAAGDLSGMGGPAEPRPDGGASQAESVFESPQDGREPIVVAADGAPSPGDALREGQTLNKDEGGGDILKAAADLLRAKPKPKLVITPAEKAAFVDSMIHNKRMILVFTPLGGALRIVIRSRTLPETNAVIARQRAEMESGRIDTRMDYSVRVRSMMMAAQVAELNGVEYKELEAPLLPVAQPSGPPAEPGWVKWIDHWAEKSDGLHAIVWQCLEQFEDKYWRMIEDAQTQDFWSPAASTSA